MWFRLVELEVHISKNDPYYTSFCTVAEEYYKVRDVFQCVWRTSEIATSHAIMSAI